ncbi:MAG: hypothetical protein ACYSUQ_07700 [Planctomycetota bacterium]|jgi:hypothetical protein
MPNFFQDNEDIRFLFDHIDLAEIARPTRSTTTAASSPSSAT